MEYREFTKEELRRNAAIVVAVIVAFSCLLIFTVRHLDELARFAPQAEVQEVEQVEETVVEDPDPVMVPTEPFYVLLIGSDSREGTALYTGKDDGESSDHRADVITLMRVDPVNYIITLVTVPRDTVLNGETIKINDSLLGNKPENTVSEVEKLTGIEIDYYMVTSFASYEFLVDALGGVTVDVQKDITVEDPITAEYVTVKAGRNQTLDGAEALVFARARKEYGSSGDVTRQANVRSLEMSMINKVMRDPDNAGAFIDALQKYTTTDMDSVVLVPTAASFVGNADQVVFYSCTGPHDGGKNKDGVWMIAEDAEAWAAIMAVVDAGEDPTNVLTDLAKEREEAAAAEKEAEEATQEEDEAEKQEASSDTEESA